MLKNIAKLEIERNGRIYELHLPNEAPLGEVHDILFLMKAYILERMKKIEEEEKSRIVPLDNFQTIEA